MTASEFGIFLNAIAAVCAAMVLLNLFMAKRRGPSSYVLAVAFLILGGTVMLYARQGTSPVVMVGGTVVVLLLIVDFIMRAPNQQTRKRR